jgi:hypothetical protein
VSEEIDQPARNRHIANSPTLELVGALSREEPRSFAPVDERTVWRVAVAYQL